MKKILLVALVATLIASCCPCKKYQKKYGKPLTETNWVMVQLDGRSFSAGEGYALKFAKDNKVSGVGDCNRIMGIYTENNDGVMKFSQMASTRMMCPNQEGEMNFLKMLETIDSYKLDGKLLMLFANGEMLSVFEAK